MPAQTDVLAVQYPGRATLCDLGVFMDQPAEPISPDDLDIGANRVGNGRSGLACSTLVGDGER
jgi:hypothetical protein